MKKQIQLLFNEFKEQYIKGFEIHYLTSFFILSILTCPPRLVLSCFIVIILSPQRARWNPLITKFREDNFFLTYKEAKYGLQILTWNMLIIFYVIHFYSRS